VPLEQARQREDVADVVVDDQHFLRDQRLVALVEAFEHTLLRGRKIGDDAVQEERRLVEQPLGRLHAFQNDALRHLAQLRFFVLRELATGENDDRISRSCGSFCTSRSSSNPEMSGQPQVEHDAVEVRSRMSCERFGSGAHRSDLDVVVPDQLLDAHALGRDRPRPRATGADSARRSA
jgi:hypothetical protein